ncbi:BTAD domain-containing putative transcriptional regulator [Longimicrobium sp.]|uniref:BTAD domain-containing putative transcriptional regulator n=1 Tax=Longimicrobium sp. TaxID=2029185 RepID=UPI002E34327B|nr:BTAD domain-containing putative transcriptional regulator [Longimicrobium sp.]HEX6038479.1 BTAD domain-containing putative transcriptional regulator [Longimicrobium sp.]
MLALKVLGSPVLVGPTGPVTGRAAYKRRIAILAVLAVARGRPLGREKVIGLLWPEHSADAARHSLSESLYVLRRELAEDVFVSMGDEIALSPRVVRSDVGAFEDALEAGRLEEAVAEYGGPLLDGFYVSDAPEFERWVDAERDRLARACAGALERLATQAEAAGNLLEAVEWWRRLAAHDPYGSRAALRLAQALDAAGERAGALRVAEAHTTRLREELGLEPDTAFTALVEGLRAEPPPGTASRLPSPEKVALPGAEDGRKAAVEADARAAEPRTDAPHDARGPADGAEQDAAEQGLHPDEAPVPGERARTGRPAPARRRRFLAGAAAVAGAAVLAASMLLPAARRVPDPPRYDPQRIAVLYFDDDSPGGELGYLASGLTGELIDELSQVPALDVMSRGAVRAYRDGQVALDSLVAGLRVGSVVEGNVQRWGDSVRVTVRLVDGNGRGRLESRTVVRPIGDLFALEDAVAREVGGFLRRRLGQEVWLRQTVAETSSPDALELVLHADQLREEAARLAAGHHPLDAASATRLLLRADTLLARAQAADPGWSRPAVMRGYVAFRRVGLVPPRERGPLLALALARAESVLARAPRNAAALELRGRARWQRAVETADGAAHDDELNVAERDLRAAVEADSTRASAWAALSQLLRVRGRAAESDLLARRALAEDAWLEDADDVLLRLFFSALAQGAYVDARRWCEQGRAGFPVRWEFVECQLTLLREDPSLRPDPGRAWRLAAELERLDPPARAREQGRAYSPLYRRAAVAAVLARAGAGDSARAVLAGARSQAANEPELRLPLLLDEAYVALVLGDRVEGRRQVEAYLAARPHLRPYLERDAVFGPLLASRTARPR